MDNNNMDNNSVDNDGMNSGPRLYEGPEESTEPTNDEQPEQDTDYTVGLNALFSPTGLPQFIVVRDDGTEQTYTIRKFNLADGLTIGSILSRGAGGIARLGVGEEMNALSIAMVIVGAMAYMEEAALSFIASIITYDTELTHKGRTETTKRSLSVRDLQDASIMPLDAGPDLIEAIARHPDLDSLLKNVRRVQKQTGTWKKIGGLMSRNNQPG